MKLEALKKMNLGNYPTPLTELKNLSKQLGKGTVYIKRDDTTGPAFGGNKTRKLEYLMQEAVDTGCTAVLTIGGTQTNHGRTTVGAAVQAGMKPILMLMGSETGYLSGNLTLDALMGADIYFVSNPETMDQAIAQVVAKYEAQGDKVYQIPIGGSNVLGAVGYIMAAKELVAQIKEQDIRVDKVVCAVGSMGTFAGLVLGAKYYGADFSVIAIPVMPQPKGEFESNTFHYAQEVNDAYDLGLSLCLEDFQVAYGPEDKPFSGEEYNKPDPDTRACIGLLAQTEGIFLDPTYTGKTFRGMVELMAEGTSIKPEENVLFIHTGGAMALWTKEHLDDMQGQIRDMCTTTQL